MSKSKVRGTRRWRREVADWVGVRWWGGGGSRPTSRATSMHPLGPLRPLGLGPHGAVRRRQQRASGPPRRPGCPPEPGCAHARVPHSPLFASTAAEPYVSVALHVGTAWRGKGRGGKGLGVGWGVGGGGGGGGSWSAHGWLRVRRADAFCDNHRTDCAPCLPLCARMQRAQPDAQGAPVRRHQRAIVKWPIAVASPAHRRTSSAAPARRNGIKKPQRQRYASRKG